MNKGLKVRFETRSIGGVFDRHAPRIYEVQKKLRGGGTFENRPENFTKKNSRLPGLRNRLFKGVILS